MAGIIPDMPELLLYHTLGYWVETQQSLGNNERRTVLLVVTYSGKCICLAAFCLAK